MQSRTFEKRRLEDMLVRLYDLVDRLLVLVSEGKKSNFSKVEELVASAEEYRSIIAREATLFIARYQPLAEDLIWSEAVISVTYDLYRIARYAREIAILSEHIGGLRGNVNDDVLELLEVARVMLRESMEAFLKGKSDIVEEVFRKDDLVDGIYRKYLDLLGRGEIRGVKDAASLLLARHVERIADHATYIARYALRTVSS